MNNCNECEKYKEALKFYANPQTYAVNPDPNMSQQTQIDLDGGHLARVALGIDSDDGNMG